MGSDKAWPFQMAAKAGRFQSTLPHGERRGICGSRKCWAVCFNPRSRMGSDGNGSPTAYVLLSFNPRSRMGSDGIALVAGIQFTRFNPRSRMGSDTMRSMRRLTSHGFNPRSRMGSDRNVWPPTEGASGFNPRSRMGSDKVSINGFFTSLMFQSTLPHGERPWPTRPNSASLRFQSTLPHGERLGTVRAFELTHGFQSTLPHGERRKRPGRRHHQGGVSIHAPAWGATKIAE